MSQTRDIYKGLFTEKSTVPVTHEDKYDSRQEAKKDVSAPESKTQLVLTARPDPSFHRYLDLPPALLALIAIFWNQEELRQCNHALVGFYCFRVLPPAAPGGSATVVTSPASIDSFLHRQFQVVHKEETRLLRAVIDADYSQAQAAVDQDLSLMFKPVYFKYRDDSSECISPLKYAFKVYDTYMWKLFYEKIKENPQYVNAFLKQAQEQTKHIDLTPLFTAYEKYIKQYRLEKAGKIRFDELFTVWNELGAAQQLILPVHMLKEFSREKNSWKAESAFDVTKRPPPSNCQIFDSPENTWKPLLTIILKQGFFRRFPLMRGEGGWNASTTSTFLLPAGFDLANFRRLFAVRVADLAKQISKLSQNAHISPEPQTQHVSSASRVGP